MRLAYESGFEPDDRIDLTAVHDRSKQQFHQFRSTYEQFLEADPETLRDYEERIRHNKRGAYITDQIAHWLAWVVDDQETMIGRKLNEKLEQVKAEGRAVNWQRGKSETVSVTLSVELEAFDQSDIDSLEKAVSREFEYEMPQERLSALMSNLTIEDVEKTVYTDSDSTQNVEQETVS